MIKILLVDDQSLVRSGIKSLLSFAENIEVIGEASNGIEAIELLAQQPVDLVLMDVQMPKLDGIQTLVKMGEQNIKVPVIMLTTFDDQQYLTDAVKLGAKGYFLKDVPLERLVEGIARVHQGKTMINPSASTQVEKALQSNCPQQQQAQLLEALSEKELEVLRLMASGFSNKEIAEVMFKSVGTVKNQVSTILAKLETRDRTRAVLKAIEMGLI